MQVYGIEINIVDSQFLPSLLYLTNRNPAALSAIPYLLPQA